MYAIDTALNSCKIERQNETFWEHFSDHLIIAFAFLILGFLFTFMLIVYLHNNKFRIDYELDRGTVMRVNQNGKKWLIVNPKTTIEWFDVFSLIIFDRKKDKFIDKQDKIRIRIVGVIFISLLILAGLSGVILLFSAFDFDVNPINWLRGYRPSN